MTNENSPGPLVTSTEGVRTREKVWREITHVLSEIDPTIDVTGWK